MSLQVAMHEREGVRVMALDGRLVAGAESAALRETIQKMAQDGERKLVLDLAKVESIDSTGLGALVMSYTTVSKAGGKLVLLNLNRRNVELLVLTKLDSVFETYSDEQDAVNSFFPGREVKKFDILSFVRKIREDEAKEDESAG